MKILEIRAMRGPNYWSIRRHKLIMMRLDLEEMEEFPSDKIPEFADRMEAMFPTMFVHHCSEGHEGGFFKRVREGTWMGHIVEHIALEIQTLAGMDVGFGRTRETAIPGIYNVVFTYMEEKAGIFAANAAVAIVEALIKSEAYELEEDIQTLREMREDERLGPSTGSIVDEAAARGIPFIRLNRRSLVQLGFGVNQKRIQATIASTTGSIAVEIACDKEETKNLLGAANIPVARGKVVYDEEDLKELLDKIGFPIVTKPVNGNHGKGATINIKTWEDAQEALIAAQRYGRAVMVERFIVGHDYRLLVINHRFVSAAKRTPAMVTGDGKSTIQQLIDLVNSDPRRGYGHEKVLTAIKVDDMTNIILKENNLTLESVLKAGQELHLKSTANLSTGGTATDVTDLVHPSNVFMAERISRIIGLDICGIDVMSPEISVPLAEAGGVILEVNAAPGFRMHIAPTEGLPRNVAEPVVDMLFPPGASSRIPIIAITGTNGKTTTTRLIAHMVKAVGHRVGYTTTDGIYIQNEMVEKGDCTGPVSAEFILKDPTVEFAVLETARGGILRAGLGFSQCDIAVVTNIAPDHLGLKDINTVEELARVKAVLPESVHPEGYAILNADDDLVYAMHEGLACKVALFSMDEKNPRLLRHCEQGGYGATVENGYITICKGMWKMRVAKVVNIPLTFGGKAIFMIQNILPAALAGFIRNFKLEDIRSALETFIPGHATTPGRMNMFDFGNFNVLIDYAHNPAGLQALGRFLDKVEASPKVGIITGVGDRRDDDIVQLGQVAAGIFDEIIVRQDRHLRGRTENEIVELLLKGIRSVKPDMKVDVILNEMKAIQHAITNAAPNSYVVICSDVIQQAVDGVLKLREEMTKFKIKKEDIPNM